MSLNTLAFRPLRVEAIPERLRRSHDLLGQHPQLARNRLGV